MRGWAKTSGDISCQAKPVRSVYLKSYVGQGNDISFNLREEWDNQQPQQQRYSADYFLNYTGLTLLGVFSWAAKEAEFVCSSDGHWNG